MCAFIGVCESVYFGVCMCVCVCVCVCVYASLCVASACV